MQSNINILAQKPNSNIYSYPSTITLSHEANGVNPGVLLILAIGVICTMAVLFKAN